MPSLVDSIQRVAARWQDPSHAARARAVERTLGAANAFTAEAVAFAINQQMQALRHADLDAWSPSRAGSPATVGVLNAGLVPFDDLADFLVVVLAGHRYLGSRPEGSPYLLPAFTDEVRRQTPDVLASFTGADEAVASSDAVLGWADDEDGANLLAGTAVAGIPAERVCLRPARRAAAVIDARWTADDWEQLAEDALLHEGRSLRNVSVVWAPRGASPDPLLEAFALFRGVFPAHASTPGGLKMPAAFLKAGGQPHAHGEGFEFLVSKGEPEGQGPGHVRWSEYDDLSEVAGWLAATPVTLLVARPDTAERLGTGCLVVPPGAAHRPSLDRPDYAGEALRFVGSLR